MKFKFNIQPLKPRRRELRHKSTKSEEILWRALRNKNQGERFVRQFSIEGYVVDFYCPKFKLAIELEGEIHRLDSVKIYDHHRQRHLEAFNIKFIIFTNDEVKNNLFRVLEVIKSELASPLLDQERSKR